MRFDNETVTAIARRYTTSRDFRAEHPGAYNYAWRNGLLKSFTWFARLRRDNGTITYEHCRHAAMQFTSVAAFRRECITEYVVSSKKGWLDGFTWLSHRRNSWTPESVTELARGYAAMGDFYAEQRSAYHYAQRYGLLDGFTWLSRRKSRWNAETVTAIARKYSSVGEFCRRQGGAYQYAWKNGLLDTFTWLSRIRRKSKPSMRRTR